MPIILLNKAITFTHTLSVEFFWQERQGPRIYDCLVAVPVMGKVGRSFGEVCWAEGST